MKPPAIVHHPVESWHSQSDGCQVLRTECMHILYFINFGTTNVGSRKYIANGYTPFSVFSRASPFTTDKDY